MIEFRQFGEGWGGETRAAIDAILDEHTAEVGLPVWQDQLVFVAEEGGQMLGGLAATINNEWMHIDLLAVRRSVRRRGIGCRLLADAEAEARGRGLVGIWLDSHEFQAPEFYQRFGFTVFGTMAGHPPGYTRVFLEKRLGVTA